MRLLLPLLFCISASASTVTITPDAGKTVTIIKRTGDTSKTIIVTVNKSDTVTVTQPPVVPPVVLPPVVPPVVLPPVVPPVVLPPGGMQGIDFSAIGVPWPGVSVPMLSPAPADGSGIPPLAPGNEEGAVRTMCTWSHMAFDDPIVYPGQPGVAHSHTFFGNNGIDAFTTPENIRSKGTANCRGGTVNLSGYWVPTMVDDMGHAVPPLYIVTYYKTGWQPWLQGNVPPMVLPKGLRMVVGDARATPTAPQVGEGGLGPHIAWSCTDATDNMLTPANTFIPAECKTGQTLRLRVDFKQCWNGQLDSPDHKSHVADPVYVNDGVVPAGFQCPATHQVGLLPVISYNIRWPLTGDPSKYHIASDMYTGGPGGYSAHGDWMNGWDETISAVWMENCMKTRRDCGSFNLGDGRGGIEFGGN